MIESGFANLAYSRAKAAGPWQFIASTGKRMGLHQDFWVDERRDPEKSAHAASTYLRKLYAEFGDPNYVAVPTLRRMVAAGYLGRKSKRGFYHY